MSEFISGLPHLNALLNTASAVLLVCGYIAIRAHAVRIHRTCQLSAVATSVLFLASYLTYHYFHGITRFTGQGLALPIYRIILLSHTILAVAIVPLILVTLWRASKADFERHRRIARVTLPLWFYVSITGVAVYVMLYHLYPSR